MSGEQTTEVYVFGRVDGMGELHPEGSYVSFSTLRKDGEKRVHRVSSVAMEAFAKDVLRIVAENNGQS